MLQSPQYLGYCVQLDFLICFSQKFFSTVFCSLMDCLFPPSLPSSFPPSLPLYFFCLFIVQGMDTNSISADGYSVILDLLKRICFLHHVTFNLCILVIATDVDLFLVSLLCSQIYTIIFFYQYCFDLIAVVLK